MEFVRYLRKSFSKHNPLAAPPLRMQFNRKYSAKQQSSSPSTTNTNVSTEVRNRSPTRPTTTTSAAQTEALERKDQRKSSNSRFRVSAGAAVSIPALVTPFLNSTDTRKERVLTKPPLPPPTAWPPQHGLPAGGTLSRNDWIVGAVNATIADNRPISPITRHSNGNNSNNNSVAYSEVEVTPRKTKLRFAEETDQHKQFKYDGPHQVYQGPHSSEDDTPRQITCTNPADGPDRVEWPPKIPESQDDSVSSISSASRDYHQSICQSISGFPLPPSSGKNYRDRQRQKSRSRSEDSMPQHEEPSEAIITATVPHPCLNNRRGGGCAFQSYLADSQRIPVQSTEPATLLLHGGACASPPPLPSPKVSSSLTGNNLSNASPSSSLASSCAPSQQRTYFPAPSHHGPFLSNGIPSEIQDDLLRVEMLMELRKYKQALNAQIQAQQRMMQMCTSGTPSFTSQNLLDVKNHNQPPTFPGQHTHTHRGKVMDPFQIFSDNGTPSPQSQKPNEERPGTLWENDLAKHVDVADFAPSWADPHPQHLGPGARADNGNKLSGAGIGYIVNNVAMELDQNPKSASLLRGAMKNIEEFQSTQSKYPSGMMSGLPEEPGMDEKYQSPHHPHYNSTSTKQNPLLAGTGDPLQVPDFNLDAFTENFLEQQHHKQFFSQPDPPQTHPLSSQQQYQQFLTEKSQFLEKLQGYSPAGIKLMNSAGPQTPAAAAPPQRPRGPNPDQSPDSAKTIAMYRKPVAICKHRSPNNYMQTSPNESTTTSQPDEDRPPAFLLENSVIDMKIRAPGDRPRNVVTPNEVQELGNLLAQLPVLSRQQKVEEFAFRTLKPPSPVAEAESETSMLPLASSQGTLTSRPVSSGPDSRPVTEEKSRRSSRDPSAASRRSNTEQVDYRTIDTDNMSIHELVTLGRKIYRILSTLSTSAQNKSVPVTPATPPHKLINLADDNEIRVKSKSATNAVVDFNLIPNPTFVTGPGPLRASQSKSTPRVVGNNNVRTPLLFKKIVQPPPTRWDSRSYSRTHNEGGRTLTRETSRRSISSTASRPPSQTRTRTILKWDGSNANNGPAKTTSYTIRTYNNNSGDYGYQKSTRYLQQDSQFPAPVAFLQQAASNTNTSRSRSKQGRNFIKENISKIREMKKVSKPAHFRSKPLPPVTRKYDNVQSLVGAKIRDRSASLTRGETSVSRQRSSSVPPTNKGVLYRNVYRDRGRSTSPRPSTATSSKSILGRSGSGEGVKITTKPDRRRKPIVDSNKSDASVKTRRSSGNITAAKVARVQSKTSVVHNEGNKVRKSRSKTKKTKGTSSPKGSTRSSASSVAEEPVVKKSTNKGPVTGKPSGGAGGASSKVKKKKEKVKGMTSTTKKSSQRLNKKGEDNLDDPNYDDDGGGPPPEYLESTPSEHAVIKEMVKAEMDLMVESYVKDALNLKRPKALDFGRKLEFPGRGPRAPASEEEGSAIDSEKLSPVYTPPRVYDESLFSLEPWINPEGSAPGTAYTSAKETPVTTAEGKGSGSRKDGKKVNKVSSKPPTVRFSLPQKPK